MFKIWRDRAFAVAVLLVSVNACTGTTSSNPLPSPTTGATSASRHVRNISQPSSSSPCGSCSCTNDGSGGMDPMADQGDPCGGSSSGGPGSGSGTVVDNLPGDVDALPPQPNCGAASPPVVCQLAVNPGAPSGSCQQTDGSNSLSIHTTLGSVNKNGVTTVRSVIDVNQINVGINPQIINNQTVVSGWASVGWIYLDNNGGLWFQADPSAQWTVAVNLNVNQYFGLAFTPPPAQTPVYVKNRPTVAPINNNLQAAMCWANGRALVPGATISS